jgi:Phage integrase, N-terminal SAM-like domain
VGRFCAFSFGVQVLLFTFSEIIIPGITTMADLSNKPSPGLRPPSPVPTGEGRLGKFLPNPKLKLREQLAEVCRYRHMSHRSENAYWHWIKGFILFHREPTPSPSKEGNGREWQHPRDLGADEVRAYLSHLASVKNVAKATQLQALNAIVFLYRDVLNVELGVAGRVNRFAPRDSFDRFNHVLRLRFAV